MSDTAPLAITVPEAGRLIGVGRSTAWSMARAYQLPTIRFRGSVRVPVAALAAWVAANTQGGPAGHGIAAETPGLAAAITKEADGVTPTANRPSA